MNSHLWYPQLDLIDTIRRLATLLRAFTSAPGFERLCIADFYLANPPLLHHASMPAEVRKVFLSLQITKPEKSFLTYPSAPLLFRRMEPTQKDAVDAMLGRGLLSNDLAMSGKYWLSKTSVVQSLSDLGNEEELKLCRFIVEAFLGPEDIGNLELKRRTGLSRVM
ncbi:ABC-three component system middle component 5 [Solimonas marina]|uniref:Uncharacterized protein n=1 Tax=Solimonas marina TaxID=2714601 RepID=A0A969WCD4_9GAMM|nr:ABC-three component system middle component 5 [Solimonas marina]NKF23614.1 hypothetical protein [Solimonas marina]